MKEVLDKPHEDPEGDPEVPDADYLEVPRLDDVPQTILALLAKGEFDMREFAEAVSPDPRIGDQLMRLASSPLYGASQRFETVSKAAVYLGLRTALSIGLGFSLFSSMRKGKGTRAEQWCWRRILINAVAARELARITKLCPVDLAFLAGMAQDLGLLLLLQQRPLEYRRLFASYLLESGPFAEIEVRTLGVSHAQVSEALLIPWGFPAEGVEAIARHHDPDLGKTHANRLARILRAAESVSEFLLHPRPATYRELEQVMLDLDLPSDAELCEPIQSALTGARSLADILSVEFLERRSAREMVELALRLEEEARQALENADLNARST